MIIELKNRTILQKLFFMPFLLFVTSCASTNNMKNTELLPETKIIKVYPELVPIEIPQGPKLYSFKMDVPRNKNEIVVKNTTECKNVPESKRDEKFWNKCGENPPLTDTNIFLGFDQENFNNFVLTMESMREYIITLKKIIEEVNRQREEWRLKNKEILDNLK